MPKKISAKPVAPKKAPARRRAAKPAAAPVDLDVQTPELLALTLDYPREKELVTSREYTLRLTAPESVLAVEVSIDDGPWLACRPSVGHWWYDWSSYETGRHVVRARPGGTSKSLTRALSVQY